ncbi:MAG: SDR family NAD(P)-dependent oxidoreductase, partial [Bacteroidales bacterium]|nr:SDR family NAD(P)-dependent oxidoreductase [Bacteroidales bacterium]
MAEKILVSGGAGYIGSHTVVELLQHGFEVVIVDDLSNSSEAIIQQIAQITGKESVFEKFNLCDKEKTRDFFQRHPDLSGAIHFAA